MITVCPGENIQRLLNTHGFYGGPESKIDEKFGPKTNQALKYLAANFSLNYTAERS